MQYDTSIIVSAYTGILCCEIDELIAFFRYICGYPIDKNNEKAVANAVKLSGPWLEKKFRWLKTIDRKDCNKDNWESWIANISQQFGSRHNVMPIPAEWWEKLATRMNREIADELRKLRIASKAKPSLN